MDTEKDNLKEKTISLLLNKEKCPSNTFIIRGFKLLLSISRISLNFLLDYLSKFPFSWTLLLNNACVLVDFRKHGEQKMPLV